MNMNDAFVGSLIFTRSGGGNVEALINPDDFLTDTFIIPLTGAEGKSSGWKATPFIAVVPDEVLTVAARANSSSYFSWYDKNKTWITSFTMSDYGYVLLTVPSDAHYVRFSNQDINMQHLQVWRGIE